ncbi:hypothetical protein [Streptomyces sp. NBC_00467]
MIQTVSRSSPLADPEPEDDVLQAVSAVVAAKAAAAAMKRVFTDVTSEMS